MATVTMFKEDLVKNLIKSLWLEPTKDLEVVCGSQDIGSKQTLQCHKPVLAMASPFLQNILQDCKFKVLLLFVSFDLIQDSIKLKIIKSQTLLFKKRLPSPNSHHHSNVKSHLDLQIITLPKSNYLQLLKILFNKIVI